MAEERELALDVAVIGGGFAGVYCGKALAKCLRGTGLKAGIISEENYTVFQPMLPSVAAASISPRDVVNPIRQLCRGIRVYKGRVAKIDVENKQLHVNAGDFTPNVIISFKHLVITLGALVDLSRVPGMPEHALLMQNVGDAMKVRATIIGRFEEANLVLDPEVKRRLLTFVVVGGGYAGVETAGEIFDLMHAIHPYYSNVNEDDFGVVLVHSRDHLLPTASPELGRYCQRILEARGMRIFLNERVQAITANSVFLGDGSRIESSSVISTIGNGPHPLVLKLAEDLGIEHEKGRLKTDAYMRIAGIDWLWSAGDCAAVPHPAGGTCPPTAQFAQRQGKVMGRNISASLRGEQLKPFTFKGLGELAAIGNRKAIAQLGRLKFQGFFAWWLWRTVYLAKLPGMQRKLRIITDWTMDLFFPKDINLLNPRYTRPLKFVHLEPGDVLFKPGEPAFSLYFVKEGVIDVKDGEHLVKEVMAGDYFGERALLQDRIWRYTAMARTPCTLIGLGADEFLAITEGSQALRQIFTRSAQAYLTTSDLQELKAHLSKKTLAKTARDLMNPDVDCVTPETSVREALALFRAKRHGSYPVVDEKGMLLGSLKRDTLFDFLKGRPIGNATIKELPFDQLPRTGLDSTGERVLEMLLRSNRNKILITDEDGVLEGIITMVDLIEDSFSDPEAHEDDGLQAEWRG